MKTLNDLLKVIGFFLSFTGLIWIIYGFIRLIIDEIKKKGKEVIAKARRKRAFTNVFATG